MYIIVYSNVCYKTFGRRIFAVTKQAIADHIGISRTTVSLVLNNSKNNTISTNTKHKVLKVAKELGYRSNDSLNKICFILYNRSGDDPRYFADLRSIERCCSKKNYMMIFMSIKSNVDDFQKLKEFITSDDADGIILSGDVDNTIIDILNEGTIPFVVYSGIEKDDTHILMPDSYKITYEAVKCLLKYGHKRIALFLGSLNLLIHQQVLAGYEQALSEEKVEIDRSLLQVSIEEDGYEIAERMQILNIPYTAAFCANTIIQFTALQWFKEDKTNVPKRVSLVGYGLSNLVKLSTPQLTTFYVDYAESAKIVVDTLLKIINGETVEKKITYINNYKIYNGKTLEINED